MSRRAVRTGVLRVERASPTSNASDGTLEGNPPRIINGGMNNIRTGVTRIEEALPMSSTSDGTLEGNPPHIFDGGKNNTRTGVIRIEEALPTSNASNGTLEGNPPRIFDGGKNNTSSAAFLQDFRIYHKLNKDALVMRMPYQRVALALTYIRGPDVDDWVDDQWTAVTNKVTNQTTTTPANDEQLWTDFVATFESAFGDTNEKQKALNELKALKMEDGNVDTYIAKFKHLTRKAGYLSSERTINMFTEGLQGGARRRISQREDLPSTLIEWFSATREERDAILQAQLEFKRQMERNAGIGIPPQTGSRSRCHEKQPYPRPTHLDRGGEDEIPWRGSLLSMCPDRPHSLYLQERDKGRRQTRPIPSSGDE